MERMKTIKFIDYLKYTESLPKNRLDQTKFILMHIDDIDKLLQILSVIRNDQGIKMGIKSCIKQNQNKTGQKISFSR